MSEETSGSEAVTETKQSRRLTAEEWNELVTAYEYGTHGIVELSKKYGISRQAIDKEFKKRGTVRYSRRAEYEAMQKQQQAAAARVAERFAEKRAEYIEETRMQGYAALKQAVALLNKRVLDVYKMPGTPPASAMEDIKALKLYQKALIENFEFRLGRLLNADDVINEDDLPNLVVDDMTVDDVIRHFQEKNLIDEDADLDELRRQIETTQEEVRNLA